MTRKTLSIDVRVGESVTLDRGRAVITVESKSGQRARLTFNVNSDVVIERPQQHSAAVAARGGVRMPR